MLSAHWSQALQHHHFPMEMEARGTDHRSSPLPLRKRKAESQPESNDRLSKRLSLLNLEQSGTKLYVPVENSQARRTDPTPISPLPSTSLAREPQLENDSMQLDDSKHKVYIYNIDDELSSESESEDGRLVFLPDIEKHLRQNRIPAQVLASSGTDFLGKELVLYSIPSSISVPEEKDSVRKAIIEARARVREQQEAERTTGSRVPDFGTASSLPGQAQVGLHELTDATNGLNHYSQGPFAPAPSAVGAGTESDEMDLD